MLPEQAPGHNFDNNNMKSIISCLLFLFYKQFSIFITILNCCCNCGSVFIVFQYHLIILFDFGNYFLIFWRSIGCLLHNFIQFIQLCSYLFLKMTWFITTSFIKLYFFLLSYWLINNLSIICSRIQYLIMVIQAPFLSNLFYSLTKHWLLCYILCFVE